MWSTYRSLCRSNHIDIVHRLMSCLCGPCACGVVFKYSSTDDDGDWYDGSVDGVPLRGTSRQEVATFELVTSPSSLTSKEVRRGTA